MRLIDAEALKEEIDYYIREANWGDEANKVLNWCKEFIDNAPTVESNEDLKTKPVVIVDDLGQSIRGYYDPVRKLIYTGYGIVSSRWLNDKKYKMISQPEDSEVKDGGKVE